MESSTMEQAGKIFKSSLPEKTKEFMLFVIAQITKLDVSNSEKLAANSKSASFEKLKEWHDNGSIYYEMPIKNGERNGLFQMWQVNGKLMCEMPFEKGKINGKAVLYKADGVEELLFKDDYPILLDK